MDYLNYAQKASTHMGVQHHDISELIKPIIVANKHVKAQTHTTHRCARTL